MQGFKDLLLNAELLNATNKAGFDNHRTVTVDTYHWSLKYIPVIKSILYMILPTYVTAIQNLKSTISEVNKTNLQLSLWL